MKKMQRNPRRQAGFTLIETMVAISILMVAIIAPMALASQALATAIYSRDEITASYLGQEGIEIVRSVRDSNLLKISQGQGGTPFDNIPLPENLGDPPPPFTADPLAAVPPDGTPLQKCDSGTCPVLNTNGESYAYDSGSGWKPSIFTRTITATPVPGNPDDVSVTVNVVWQEGNFQSRTFTLTEDLYAWITGS